MVRLHTVALHLINLGRNNVGGRILLGIYQFLGHRRHAGPEGFPAVHLNRVHHSADFDAF